MSNQNVNVRGFGCFGTMLAFLMAILSLHLLAISLGLSHIEDAIEANTAACSQQEPPK
jgi:hypothetical protein